MKFTLRIFCFFILLLSSQVAFAQNKDTLVTHYLNQAKIRIDEGKYAEANELFKKIFGLRTPVPDELAYYYGYTLLRLKKYSQSRNALNKYIKLTGETGPLYPKARAALNELDCEETGYRETYIPCDVCYGDSTIHITCRQCKGKGVEVCPLCKGTGVTTANGNFGQTYHTCTRCAGEKIIKCTVCKGKGKEHVICYTCNGKGKVKIRKKC